MINRALNFMGGFFRDDKPQSMMRLCTFILVYGGYTLTAIVVLLQLDGAHYGLELVGLGLIGKSVQKKQEKKD